MNIHLHCLVLDGVYLKSDRVAVFHEAPAPSTDELETVLLKIITRTMRHIDALGGVIEEPDRTYLAETDTNGALRVLQAASCTYCIALGPRAGQKVLSLRSLPSAARPSAPELRVNAHGFSFHGAVRWRADQRAELEHLCSDREASQVALGVIHVARNALRVIRHMDPADPAESARGIAPRAAPRTGQTFRLIRLVAPLEGCRFSAKTSPLLVFPHVQGSA